MSILKRVSSIFKSNVNSVLDSVEDPSKMVDQTMRDLKKDLEKVTQETASVMAEKRSLEASVHEMEVTVEKLVSYAKKAVDSGNEEDARRFLTQKNSVLEKLNSKKSLLAQVSANEEKLRGMQQNLSSKVAELESKQSVIKLKAEHAKAQERINKMTSSFDGTSLSKFDDYEAKIDKKLNASQAEYELKQDPNDISSLVSKYEGSDISIDDELESLRNA